MDINNALDKWFDRFFQDLRTDACHLHGNLAVIAALTQKRAQGENIAADVEDCFGQLEQSSRGIGYQLNNFYKLIHLYIPDVLLHKCVIQYIKLESKLDVIALL